MKTKLHPVTLLAGLAALAAGCALDAPVGVSGDPGTQLAGRALERRTVPGLTAPVELLPLEFTPARVRLSGKAAFPAVDAKAQLPQTVGEPTSPSQASPATPAPDADGDGFPDGADCDDHDPLINPAAADLPGDGVDSDCTGWDLSPADAVGIFVSAGGDDTAAGTMGAPLASLDEAVARAAVDGRSVFVSAGTYTLAGTTQVSIHGGYDATTWLRDLSKNPTIILGAGGAAVHVLAPGGRQVAITGVTLDGRSACIGAAVGEQTSLIIDGARIIGGGEACATSYGVAAYGLGSHLIVRDSLVTGGSGARTIAIDVGSQGATAIVERTQILAAGGFECFGIRVRGLGASLRSRAFLRRNVFLGGSNACHGRSIVVESHARVILERSVIRGADIVVNGGQLEASTTLVSDAGVDLGSGDHVLKGNLFDAARVYLHAGAAVTAVNNIFLHMPLRVSPDATIVLAHNVLWAPDAACLVEGGGCVADIDAVETCTFAGCAEAAGNLAQDPRLVAPEMGDYHLAADSPCIDAGIDPSQMGVTAGVDLDGESRPRGAAWDIGPDEH